MPESIAARYMRSSTALISVTSLVSGATAAHHALIPTTASPIPITVHNLDARPCAEGEIHSPQVIPAVHKPLAR